MFEELQAHGEQAMGAPQAACIGDGSLEEAGWFEDPWALCSQGSSWQWLRASRQWTLREYWSFL